MIHRSESEIGLFTMRSIHTGMRMKQSGVHAENLRISLAPGVLPTIK